MAEGQRPPARSGPSGRTVAELAALVILGLGPLLAVGIGRTASASTSPLTTVPGPLTTIAGDVTTSSPAPTDGPRGVLAFDPALVDFGEVPVSQSEEEVVTATAIGGPVEDISFEVDGPFEVGSDCIGIELAEGEHCSFEVRFAPTAPGDVSGALDITADTGEETLRLRGRGVSPSSTSSDSPDPTDPPPTTSGPTTTAVTPTVPTETRDECDRRAAEADLHYPPELQMQVGESTVVEASATTGEEPTPTSTSSGGVVTTVVQQPLRCQVRARLVGNDFTVNPDDWQNRSFLGTDEVQWVWLVTPQRTGDDLLLVLEVQGLRFDAEAGAYVEAGEAFQETAEIDVESEPESLWSSLNSGITGVVTHPVFALLASTGGLAFLAGMAYRRLTAKPTGTTATGTQATATKEVPNANGSAPPPEPEPPPGSFT